MTKPIVLAKLNDEQIAKAKEANGPKKRITHFLFAARGTYYMRTLFIVIKGPAGIGYIRDIQCTADILCNKPWFSVGNSDTNLHPIERVFN